MEIISSSFNLQHGMNILLLEKLLHTQMVLYVIKYNSVNILVDRESNIVFIYNNTNSVPTFVTLVIYNPIKSNINLAFGG